MRFSRDIVRLLVIVVSLSPLLARAQGQGTKKFKPTDKYVPGQVIVRYKDGVAAPTTGASVASSAMAGAKVERSFRKIRNLRVIQLPEGTSVQQAVEQLRADPNVLYAEPDYIVHTDEVVPNDTLFPQLWAMKNTGQSGGTADADIDATDAWTLSTGSNSVIVGNIDTGVDYNHPDLAGNIFNNPSDCNFNGVDDDGNGYVDDCHGISPVYGNSNPYDDNGHGTHTSGTIGALGNNGSGVVGVNWHVTIMPCKFLDSSGFGPYSAAIACLDYFAAMKDLGYNIVATNNSWGGGSYSQALYDAIKENMDRGILFIAAAGNGGADHVGDNNDQLPNYPSNYDLLNIIAVAATTRTDAKASFSNYGRRRVDLGAPGLDILSTLPYGNYGVYSGTSMATPHVTGTVALLKAYNPALTWYELRNLILAGGDVKTSMANTFTGKRLNAFGSLTCANRPVSGRLTPDSTSTIAGLGDTVLLSYLNINCKDPAGAVSVTASQGGTIQLHDDGLTGDLVAGDGAYSAGFNVYGSGTTTVSFPGNDVVSIKTLRQYNFESTAFSYRNITGTNLQLSDELAKAVTTPFVIKFGGSSYSSIYVGSNGLISFDSAFNSPVNFSMPVGSAGAFIAPWWQDLQPYPNTNQNVFTAMTGTSPNREFVVEWRDVPMWNYPTQFTVKFQVVFFENSSNVLINYADANFADGYPQNQGGYATVGIQVAGKSAVQYSFLQQSLSDGSALLWTPEPDGFDVQLAQPLVKTYAGQASHFDVTVRSTAAFNSDVTVSCGGLQVPSTCTPATVHPTHEGVNASVAVSDPAVGDKDFQLMGTAAIGGSQHQVPATLRVSDLAIDAANPATVTVPHGASSQDISVTLHATGTFDSAVNMSCAGLPAGATCRFNPSATVYPTNGSPLDVHVNVDTAFSTPLATTSFQINAWPVGMTAPRSDSADLTTVINTDFSLTPSTTSFTGSMGAGYKGTVLVEAHDGYSGTVNLSCSVVPAGPSCSLDNTSTATFPLTVNVTVGLNGMQADDYHIVITGNDGSHSHAVTTLWQVAGFQVTVPSTISIYAQATNYVPVTITRINGYRGDLYLSCSAGTIYCNAYSPGSSGTSIASVSFSSPDALDPVATTLVVSEFYPGTAKVQNNLTATVKGFTLSYGALTTQTVFPGETPQPYQVTLTPYNGYDLTTSFYCNGYVGQGNCSASPAGPWSPNGSPYTINLNTTVPLNQNYAGGTYWVEGNFYASVPRGVYVSQNTRSFNLQVKDFIAGVSPYWIYLDQGGSTNATVTPNYSGGLDTPIQVTCPSLPTGITCDVTPNRLSSGQTAVLTLSASQAATTQVNNVSLTSTGQLGTQTATRQSQFYIAVQTFNTLANPSSSTVVIGGSAQYGVSFTSPNGFYFGNITLGCTNLPAGVTCQANPPSVPYSAYTSVITVTTTPGVTPAGANTVTLTAASAGIQRSVPVTLNVQDFTLTSTTPSGASNPGASSSFVITTKAFAGFNSAVVLACAGLPAGATCSFSGNNFVPSATGTNTTVTVATTLALPGGIYPFTINASSQGQTRTLNATLTVKDYHLASTPSSRKVGMVPPGQTDHTTYALSAFADNGFSSSVALSCATPLPTGVTCAFNPASLTPTAGGAASTLTVAVSSTTPPGTFALNVKAVSGSIIRQLPLTLTTGGPNFTQAVSPTMVNAVRGSGGSFTVTYTLLGGMTDPIAVGCSTPAAGITCSAVPDAVVPGTTPNNQSVVTFIPTGAAAPVNTAVTITGSAIAIVRSNSETLSVKDFSLTSTTVGDLSINAGATAMRGVQVKSLNGLTGTVALSCAIEGAPAGVTCTVPASAASSAAGVNVNATIATTPTAPTGGYLVTVSGTNGGQTRQHQFTTQVRDYTVLAQGSVSIGSVPTGHTDVVSIAVILRTTSGFNSTVTLSCVTPLPTGVTCLFNPASLVPNYPGYPSVLGLKVSSTTPNGSYPITVRSTAGTLVKNTAFTLNVGGPNFLPTITPGTAGSLLGTPATYAVTYLVAGGMNTPIDVSCQSPTAGIVCSANPTQVTPGVTPGNQSVITVTGTPGTTPLANANIFVMGESVDLNRRRGIVSTYAPRDFSLSTTTPARTLNAASSLSNGVTVRALNGFSGPVTLACSIDGAPAGMSCALPASVSPSAAGTGIGVSVLTTTVTPAGTYTVHVSGTNSGQTRSMTFTVDVRDFSLGVTPASQAIPGTGTGSTTFSLTLTALNGFTSSAFLSCLGPLPVGLTCSFSPGSVVPTAAGAPSTLTINVTATNSQGDHPVNVRAVSGALVRQQTITITHGP